MVEPGQELDGSFLLSLAGQHDDIISLLASLLKSQNDQSIRPDSRGYVQRAPMVVRNASILWRSSRSSEFIVPGMYSTLTQPVAFFVPILSAFIMTSVTSVDSVDVGCAFVCFRTQSMALGG